jgi:thiamine-phosphate pyrophosphorylase
MMTNLIVISHEFDVVNETALVNELFNEGMQLFHLKKPLWDVDSQRNFLEAIHPEFHSKISVHQHYETITEYGLKYYHVREKARKSAGYPPAEGLIRSTSFHNYDELKTEGFVWDYCFLSPVFDSISKKNYKSGFSSDMKIENGRQKIFALGGVSDENIEHVFERGFYGAVISGALWMNSENAIKNFREIKDKCSRNVHTC